jgi:hypothetical protein
MECSGLWQDVGKQEQTASKANDIPLIPNERMSTAGKLTKRISDCKIFDILVNVFLSTKRPKHCPGVSWLFQVETV